VPSKAEPPATLLTDQATVVFGAPVTVAENVSEAPARILAVAGATDTATVAAGGGGCFCSVGDPPDAQPESSEAMARTLKLLQMQAKRVCIEYVVWRVELGQTTGRRDRNRPCRWCLGWLRGADRLGRRSLRRKERKRSLRKPGIGHDLRTNRVYLCGQIFVNVFLSMNSAVCFGKEILCHSDFTQVDLRL
jgi:hypothetical protein